MANLVWICYCSTLEQAMNKADYIERSGYQVDVRSSMAFGRPIHSIYRSKRKGNPLGYANDERDAKLTVAGFHNRGVNAWYVKTLDNRYKILKAT